MTIRKIRKLRYKYMHLINVCLIGAQLEQPEVSAMDQLLELLTKDMAKNNPAPAQFAMLAVILCGILMLGKQAFEIAKSIKL